MRDRRKSQPKPIYRIKRNGVLVTVQASKSDRGFHLQVEDQQFAREIVQVIEEACVCFYAKEPIMHYNPEFDVLTDDEVEERIRRLDEGEHFRETNRSVQPRFPLTELSPSWKRALVARLDQVACEWGFEKMELAV